MSDATLTPAQRQQRLGWQAIAAFAVGTLVLWLASPVKQLVSEHLMPHIAYQAAEQGFSEGFGALPALVKDGGGTQPVPFAPVVVHAPEYRDATWVLAQESADWTLQIAALADEQSVLSFLAGRDDRDHFRYFRVSSATGEGARLVLVTGDYASRGEAEAAGVELSDLPASPLARGWSAYQGELRAASAVAAPVQAPAPAPAAPPLNESVGIPSA